MHVARLVCKKEVKDKCYDEERRNKMKKGKVKIMEFLIEFLFPYISTN